jgi:hypothetical protein
MVTIVVVVGQSFLGEDQTHKDKTQPLLKGVMVVAAE